MARRAQSNRTTDHDEIRQWAEERGAEPACVRGTGGEGDIGVLRLEFPGAPGARDESLQSISWDDWFGKFDERGLALLFQTETARGQKSNFNKLISRETASAGEEGKTKSSRRRRGRSAGRAVAVMAASRSRSKARQAAGESSRKLSARRAGSTTRAKSGRKETARTASEGRSKTRASGKSKGKGRSRPTRASRSKVVEIRGGTRSRRTGSARGRENSRTRRRAA